MKNKVGILKIMKMVVCFNTNHLRLIFYMSYFLNTLAILIFTYNFSKTINFQSAVLPLAP